MFTFYLTRVLNLSKETCIRRVNSFAYIVIHRHTCFVLSELFSVSRQARYPKLGWKPSWLKRQSKILPLSHEETSASEGNLNAYVSHLFTYIRLTATESSIIYIYIYIYCQYIFVFILSSNHIDFLVSGGNSLVNLSWLIGSQVLSVQTWAIINIPTPRSG